MTPVVGLLEDLLLVGDFDSALEVIGVLVHEAGGDGSTNRRQHAITAIDLLIVGSMMRHITTHLATIEEAQFERVKAMCVSLGEVLVRPLARGVVGGSAAAHARTVDLDPAGVRIGRTADDRTAEDLREPRPSAGRRSS